MIGIPTKRTLWATSHVSGRTGMHRSCLIYAGTTIFMSTGEHSFNDLPNLASLLRSCFWKYKKYVFFLGLSDRVPQNWMVYDGLCLFSLLDMPKLEVYPNFRHTPIEREWALDVEGVDSVSPAVSSWFLGFPNHQMVEAVSCMKTARSSIIQWRVTTPFGCKS